ncbi:hypothetical protein [Caulobacter sp.]|uniref:hypothetical protein n=1 Tax=Caulobacter sp. TaxID=78 RepID=UPI003BAABC1B
MIDLEPTLKRIRALLAEDTEQSATYAALEARLALERVCYDRLQQHHDYISSAQLRKWQPAAVINTLIAEVDEHAAVTRTFSVSKGPAIPGGNPADEEYVTVGTEVGFNPKLVGELWNALSGLALHVKLPKKRGDHIPDYGDACAIRTKVEEVLTELERLSQTTMTFSGFGPEVSFTCSCGEKNKRRAGLLKEGHSTFCINPNCKASYRITKDNDEFTFESELTEVKCEKCNEVNSWPVRTFYSMKYDQTASFNCRSCGSKNLVRWRLMRRVRPDGGPTATP